ncbi:hypothetical protein [Amycolatopsis sp. RTGN1]|uniref:hypothetical protein n=1 Tax=Amycolatopsis ponsaeliensis TaxID=2992142 RepID=UPI00254F0865|nr:hypothetical protein [Amycolatopsis sp. RTGN1]
MEILVGALSAVLGALVGGVVTYLTTRSKLRLELAHAYDQAVREKRLARYQRLFHLSEAIPRYWKPGEEPSRERLLEICEEFHGWYFDEDAGGLYLTPRAMDVYMRLQNALATACHGDDAAGHTSEAPMSPDESREIRDLADTLRHQLAQDVGTSSPPRLRLTRLDPAPPPPRGR